MKESVNWHDTLNYCDLDKNLQISNKKESLCFVLLVSDLLRNVWNFSRRHVCALAECRHSYSHMADDDL